MAIAPRTTDHLDYFPLQEGLPKMSIGLKRLAMSAQSARDHVFQFDDSFSIYRDTKIESRLERLSKYYQSREAPPSALIRWMVERLQSEHPDSFAWRDQKLTCRRTGEVLALTEDWHLDSARTQSPFIYVDAFDALAMNVAEDLVFMHQTPAGQTEARLIHLTMPNDWAAEQAIGQSFEFIHKPVPGIDTIIRRPVAMIQGIVQQATSFERVGAIGFRTQTRLNEHPEVSKNVRSPAFSAEAPSLFVRFERQTVTGFPQLGGFLFTIRTYFRDLVTADGRPDPQPMLRKVFHEDLSGQHVNHYSKSFIEAHRAELIRWVGV